jgi:hypothetical protein
MSAKSCLKQIILVAFAKSFKDRECKLLFLITGSSVLRKEIQLTNFSTKVTTKIFAVLHGREQKHVFL